MARVRERNTGSIVNVPDDKVAQVVALGYYEPVEEQKKPAAKRSARSADKHAE